MTVIMRNTVIWVKILRPKYYMCSSGTDSNPRVTEQCKKPQGLIFPGRPDEFLSKSDLNAPYMTTVTSRQDGDASTM